jgi:hypothetical protein
LCHAEIEYYLEKIALEVTENAFITWSVSKGNITPIIFHLAYNYKLSSDKSKEPPYSMVVLSFNNYKKTIQNNHGIKESNLINLFRPIGFEVDNLLSSSLENYGAKRGKFAHTSFTTLTLLDPILEKNEAWQIITGLKFFDEDLSLYATNSTSNYIPFNTRLGQLSLGDRLRLLFLGRLK